VAKRSEIEQVKSGFRIVGWMLLTFVIAGFLVKSEMWLLKPEEAHDRAFGAAILPVISVLLYLGARRWLKWFLAACGLAGMRMLFPLILGIDDRNPANPKSVSRTVGLEYEVAIVCILFIGTRFFSHRPKPIESFGFTALVIALGWALASESVIPVVIGIVIAALTRLAGELSRRKLLVAKSASQPEQLP